MEPKENVVLIGMPGVGKSTAGVIVAKMLGYHFIDTDLLIQSQEKALLSQLIERLGETGFLSLENKTVAGLCAQHAVIATGGSVVYGADAMRHLCQLGTIVYLKLDYDTICSRLDNLRSRGVILTGQVDFKQVYDERVLLYEKYADIVVDERDCDIEQTVQKILQSLQAVRQAEVKQED